jgi:hypothetical protein
MNGRILGQLLICLLGLLICIGSGYAVYWMASLIFGGALSQDWLMVIAGGILAYLFMGVLCVVFVIGLVIFAVGLSG